MNQASFGALLAVGILCSGADSSHLYGRQIVAAPADDSCTPLRTKAAAMLSQSLNVTGTWVSARCEMAKGPQFLLRKYEFNEAGSFRVVKFYYSDEACAEPAYALYAAGRLRVDGPSWVVDEGFDVSYSVDHAVLMTYTQTASDIIAGLVSPQCRRRLGAAALVPYTATPLKRAAVVEDGHLACTDSLDVSMNELNVMRQTNYASGGSVDRELQLGRSDGDDSRRRPSALQAPLKAATKAASAAAPCETCACVLAATVSRPPRGCGGSSRHDGAPKSDASRTMDGRSWYSRTCESHSTGLFALKTLSFSGGAFRMEVRYFSDAFCTVEQFAITAAGKYHMMEAHSKLHDAAIFEFAYKRVTATSKSDAMTDTLNVGSTDGCAISGPWRLGVEQDVTSTGGCATLGVSLSPVEYAVLKVDRSEAQQLALYISDSKKVKWTATDVITFSENPLQSCQRQPRNWTPAEPTDVAAASASALSVDAGLASASEAERRNYLIVLTSFLLARF